MDTYPDNWPKGLPETIPEVQSQRDWLKDQLLEMQEDQALYSQLKDDLTGKDVDTDILLEEIQSLQLEIINIIGKELIK